MERFGSVGRALMAAVVAVVLFGGCGSQTRSSGRWHERYAYVDRVPPIVFHYDHGVLAGSYRDDGETVQVRFGDVCAQLGHVCLCGAGGYKIAEMVLEAIGGDGKPLERGDFVLISSRDHTVSDVIALVLGCSRRGDAQKSQYFIDDSVEASRREYHYYVAYLPTKTAVHVVYRKHLLIGNEEMDKLWKIECGFEEDPSSVSEEALHRYRHAMVAMVGDVLFERVDGLITVRSIRYEEFQGRLNSVRQRYSSGP